MSFDYDSIVDDGEYGPTIRLEIGDSFTGQVTDLKTVDGINGPAQVLEVVTAGGPASFWPKKMVLSQMKALKVGKGDSVTIGRGPDEQGKSDKYGTFTRHTFTVELAERASVVKDTTKFGGL